MTAREQGSASVIVLGIGLCVLAIAMGLCAVGAAVALRHKAQAAGDLAALAGAGRIGIAGEPCEAARDMAVRNGAELMSCIVELAADGRSGRVDVRVRARARLGGAYESESVTSASAERLPGESPP